MSGCLCALPLCAPSADCTTTTNQRATYRWAGRAGSAGWPWPARAPAASRASRLLPREKKDVVFLSLSRECVCCEIGVTQREHFGAIRGCGVGSKQSVGGLVRGWAGVLCCRARGVRVCGAPLFQRSQRGLRARSPTDSAHSALSRTNTEILRASTDHQTARLPDREARTHGACVHTSHPLFQRRARRTQRAARFSASTCASLGALAVPCVRPA